MRGLQHLVDSEPAMMDRRGFLTIATVGAAAALAGCAGDNTGEESITFEHPDEVQIDEDFEFLIDGLPENATIDITLEAELEDGEILSPMITLETADGRIDLADAEVISGESITEEDIWDDLDVPPTRALHQFIDKRYEFYTPPREQTITYHVESEDETLGSTSLTQTYPDLRNYERSEPGDLNGEVFEPPGVGSSPGVIVLHGSDGEPSSTPAALLAEHGFTVYALQYFSGPGLPPNIIEIPLEYVERAIEWLLDHDRVSGSRVGLYGFSKGAELALLAGSQFDSVGAVVSTSGSGVVWGGFTRTETPRYLFVELSKRTSTLHTVGRIGVGIGKDRLGSIRENVRDSVSCRDRGRIDTGRADRWSSTAHLWREGRGMEYGSVPRYFGTATRRTRSLGFRTPRV